MELMKGKEEGEEKKMGRGRKGKLKGIERE